MLNYAAGQEASCSLGRHPRRQLAASATEELVAAGSTARFLVLDSRIRPDEWRDLYSSPDLGTSEAERRLS